LNPILQNNLVRRIEHVWRYGDLAVRTVQIATFVLVAVMAIAIWQLVRLRADADGLHAGIAKSQAGLASRTSTVFTAESPDFVPALPDAPTAVQVMQTLQQAAGKEGGSVVSLEAEDHPPTESTLGRLDLVISIKATYPAILIVLREALDRYPGATVRQFTLARTSTSAGSTSSSPGIRPGTASSQPDTDAEAHVVLSLWRRPLGVSHALAVPASAQPASVGAATPGTSSSADDHAASGSSPQPPTRR